MLKWFAALAAVVILVAAVITWFVCRYFFRMAIVRNGRFPGTGSDGFEKQIEKSKDLIEAGKEFYNKLEKTQVEIRSFDDLTLRGNAIRNGDSRRTLILVHGYRSTATHDFSAVIPMYWSAGFNLLVIDQRAHGDSEGEYITFGVKERFDVRDWANFAVGFFGDDTEIILDGISMGATSVLMAGGLKLPPQVRGIIADSGFISPRLIFESVLENAYHIKPFPLLYIVELFARIHAGFGFEDASTLDALAINKFPVLFLHGENDDFVPMQMTTENYKVCCAKKELVTVPGAKHACGYLLDQARCDEALERFFSQNLQME